MQASLIITKEVLSGMVMRSGAILSHAVTMEQEVRTMSARPYAQITKCPASGSEHLVSVLHLGNQALTNVFPDRLRFP